MLLMRFLDYDDQSLYDFIFKKYETSQSVEHEIFLKKILKIELSMYIVVLMKVFK